jgi:hypothetical protein
MSSHHLSGVSCVYLHVSVNRAPRTFWRPRATLCFGATFSVGILFFSLIFGAPQAWVKLPPLWTALSSASTTACSKILLQSPPKFLFHKISLPPKRWNNQENSGNLRQMYHCTTDITFVMKKAVEEGLRGRWWGFGGAVVRASTFHLWVCGFDSHYGLVWNDSVNTLPKVMHALINY